MHNRFGAFQGPARSLNVFTRNLSTHLMSFKFLQSGNDYLRQMALIETVSNLNSFIQLAFTQRARDCWSKSPRLLTCGAISKNTINHNANRPGRHNEQNRHNDLVDQTHVAPDRARVEANSFAFLE